MPINSGQPPERRERCETGRLGFVCVWKLWIDSGWNCDSWRCDSEVVDSFKLNLAEACPGIDAGGV